MRCKRSVAKYNRDDPIGDRIFTVRQTSISCAESPFVTLNINFSGPCEHKCKECHSKALWEVKSTDNILLRDLMDHLKELQEFGIINGLCILGTDNPEKEDAVKTLIESCIGLNIPSVVYTGYHITEAVKRYGLADYYICGPYITGEWSDNKEFYALTDNGEEIGYAKMSKENYYKENEVKE